jgi:hypothetical protein
MSDPGVVMRQAIERKIVVATIKALLDAGFDLAVDNGDDSGLAAGWTRDADRVLSFMFDTDDVHLMARKLQSDCAADHDACKGVAYTGWVYFVYGNDGPDVISDYTANLESVLGPVNAMADRIADGCFDVEIR